MQLRGQAYLLQLIATFRSLMIFYKILVIYYEQRAYVWVQTVLITSSLCVRRKIKRLYGKHLICIHRKIYIYGILTWFIIYFISVQSFPTHKCNTFNLKKEKKNSKCMHLLFSIYIHLIPHTEAQSHRAYTIQNRKTLCNNMRVKYATRFIFFVVIVGGFFFHCFSLHIIVLFHYPFPFINCIFSCIIFLFLWIEMLPNENCTTYYKYCSDANYKLVFSDHYINSKLMFP